MTPKEVLAIPMQENDAEADTIRDYLITLLETIWVEGEGFSGKRPFGNSGWEHEIFTALANVGAIEATFCEYDDGERELEDYDSKKGDALIMEAIASLYGEKEQVGVREFTLIYRDTALNKEVRATYSAEVAESLDEYHDVDMHRETAESLVNLFEEELEKENANNGT